MLAIPVRDTAILEEPVKTALTALLALASFGAAALYPVEIAAEMNGLDVGVSASGGVPLVITFTSREKDDLTCKASIDSGLDTPQERTVTVRAGRSATASFTPKAPNRVRVKVACRPR